MALTDYYVYGLVDPRTDAVFYVGKGRGRRLFHHVRDARAYRNLNIQKEDRIRDIEGVGLSVGYCVYASQLTEGAALELEGQFIASLPGLTNITKAARENQERKMLAWSIRIITTAAMDPDWHGTFKKARGFAPTEQDEQWRRVLIKAAIKAYRTLEPVYG